MHLLLQGWMRQLKSNAAKTDALVQRTHDTLEELTQVVALELARCGNKGPNAEQAHQLLTTFNEIEIAVHQWMDIREHMK